MYKNFIDEVFVTSLRIFEIYLEDLLFRLELH